MFQRQHSVGLEVCAGSSADLADSSQAIFAGEQRLLRFEAGMASFQFWITHADVWRVAGNHIKVHPGKGLEPVALAKINGGESEAPGVGARLRQCRWRDIGRDDVCPRAFAGESECDCTTASAEVSDVHGCLHWYAGKNLLDQDLGLRPGY